MNWKEVIYVRLGAIETEIKNLKENLFGNGIDGILPRLEECLKNHLKHHEQREKETQIQIIRQQETKSNRIFKVATIILMTLLAIAQAYIIHRLGWR